MALLNHFTIHFARRVFPSAVDHFVGDHSANHFVRKFFFKLPSIIMVSIIFNRSFWVDHFPTDHFSGRSFCWERTVYGIMISSGLTSLCNRAGQLPRIEACVRAPRPRSFKTCASGINRICASSTPIRSCWSADLLGSVWWAKTYIYYYRWGEIARSTFHGIGNTFLGY